MNNKRVDKSKEGKENKNVWKKRKRKAIILYFFTINNKRMIKV